jgi:protein TonB
MPDGLSLVYKVTIETRPMTAGPIAVLSAAPARSIWRPVAVLTAVAAHALLLLALSGSPRETPAPADPVSIEVVETAPAQMPKPAGDEPPPQADATPVAPRDEPVPVTPVDPPAPVAALADPVAPSPPEVPPPPEAEPDPAPPTPADVAPRAAAPQAGAPQAAAPGPDAAPHPPIVVSPEMPKPVRPPKPRPVIARPVPRGRAAPVTAVAIAEPTAQLAPPAAVAEPLAPSGTEQRAEASLRGQIREAVQAAVRCPAAARMMGLTGKAGVAFDYRDGGLMGGAQLTRSTGIPMLDAAALAAVRDARYPKAPPEIANHMLRLLVWVEEACSA